MSGSKTSSKKSKRARYVRTTQDMNDPKVRKRIMEESRAIRKQVREELEPMTDVHPSDLNIILK